MSKENKVNRDRYTQRGRLTPDETARELVKQREAASPRKAEGSKFGVPTSAKSDVKSSERVTEKDKSTEPEEDTD